MSKKRSKMGYNKIQAFFAKYNFPLKERKEVFDFLLKYGGRMKELRILLFECGDKVGQSFYASDTTIRTYAKLEGLWNQRQEAIRAWKKLKKKTKRGQRKFNREDRSFSTKIYKETFLK